MESSKIAIIVATVVVIIIIIIIFIVLIVGLIVYNKSDDGMNEYLDNIAKVSLFLKSQSPSVST